jgi:hypothetical protein
LIRYLASEMTAVQNTCRFATRRSDRGNGFDLLDNLVPSGSDQDVVDGTAAVCLDQPVDHGGLEALMIPRGTMLSYCAVRIATCRGCMLVVLLHVPVACPCCRRIDSLCWPVAIQTFRRKSAAPDFFILFRNRLPSAPHFTVCRRVRASSPTSSASHSEILSLPVVRKSLE